MGAEGQEEGAFNYLKLTLMMKSRSFMIEGKEMFNFQRGGNALADNVTSLTLRKLHKHDFSECVRKRFTFSANV